MDGRKDALNDAALEQEIEALLSVEPSPDFVARVRSRAAEESTSSRWGWRWPIAALTTGVALAAIGVALSWPSATSTPSTSPVVPPVAARTDEHRSVITPPRDEPVAVPERHDVARAIAAPRRAIDIALPPVIIAENETRAFAVLVKSAPHTQFDFVATAASNMTPVEVDKMPTIDLIEIKPLVKAVELE
jgi:hypothetical protein